MTQAGIFTEGWPALMSNEMAARYLCVDEETLLRLAMHFDTPAIEIEDLPHRWRRQDLDRLIKKLPSVSATSIQGHEARIFKLEASQIEALAEAVARQIQHTSSESESKLVSINDACAMLGIGRSSIYKMITEKTLETRRIGRRRLVLREDIQAILESDNEALPWKG